MCLITFAWRAHPRYDLIVAANRDEFFDRPAEAAHAWPDAPQIFAGRDQRAGGAWCGVDTRGRFAAVTNYRDMHAPDPEQRSRGELVSGFLRAPAAARDYCIDVQGRQSAYGGFNLLVADAEDFYYLGNRDRRGVHGVPPGLHALSNGVLGDSWPKTERARHGLAQAIGDDEVDTQALFDLLADDRPAADDALPDTGVGARMERLLSPIFVRSPHYGTRASSVILRGVDGSLRFIERSFDASATCTSQVDQSWPSS